MDYKKIFQQIEEVFLNLGFESVMINDIKFMKYKQYYCKITFLKDWLAFVIESSDNIQDAEKGLLEDGDLYFTDVPEEELLMRLKEDLVRDYFIC